MSDKFNFDFYLLRSPILALDAIFEFLSIADLKEQEDYLYNLLSNSNVKDALFLSSPELYKEIEKWINKHNPADEKLLKTLYKYITRMGVRSTPYGQFSGVCLGMVQNDGPESINIIRNNNRNIIKYRLDMQTLVSLSHKIVSDPEIKTRLRYTFNSSLYAQGDTLKFYQQLPSQNKLVNLLCSINSTPLISYLLSEIKDYIHYNELKKILLKKGASIQQAIAFLDKLIDCQLIVSELQPSVTGEEYFKVLLKKITRLDKGKNHTPTLQKVGQLLKSNSCIFSKQKEIQKILSDKYPNLKYRNLLQGDLLIGVTENKIKKDLFEEIGKQLNILQPLSTSSSLTTLERFKKEFSNRYEGRMVSMLEALDPDTGIPYSKNLTAYSEQDDILKGIFFEREQENDNNIQNSPYQEICLKLYSKSLQNNNSEVLIEDCDIHALKNKKTSVHELPSSFFAMGNILKDKIDNSYSFNLSSYGGTSAGNLISRFGYLDKNLEHTLEKIHEIEQVNFKNTIIAEIAHLPESRTGNILQRPDFREAEIFLMAKPSERRKSIKASDLFLFMSGSRLILWSKSLNSEIIPRLTSAHNFYRGINIYRFLADLQSQDKRLHFQWDWGILKNESFLPRVRFKNIILSRACWNIKKLKKSYPPLEPECIFQTLKDKYSFPNHVVVSEGDNELFLDLSNILAKKILLEKVSRGDVFLQEFLFSQFESPIKDSEGLSYANEIIIPMYSKNNLDRTINLPSTSNLQRIFPLSSTWIYAKIFCGHLFADTLLRTLIPTIIQELKDINVVNKWFFIRYNEPSPHIRLRIEGISENDFAIITRTIREKLSHILDGIQVVNIQFETYIREIERYTPECMVLSEELFFHDSEYVFDTLKRYPKITDRWLPAILGVHEILNSGGFTDSEKQIFCQKMKSSFATEFGASKTQELIFNQKFRDRKYLIENYIKNNKINIQSQNRSGTIKKICNVIESSNLNKRNTLLASYIHMYINRLFHVDQRLYELAIYHFLNNYYRMVIGKNKNQKNVKIPQCL